MTQTHSTGAVRAAFRIYELAQNFDEHTPFVEIGVRIIDEETHAAEMQGFIDKIAAWDYKTYHDPITGFDVEPIEQAQRDAFALIAKLRG